MALKITPKLMRNLIADFVIAADGHMNLGVFKADKDFPFRVVLGRAYNVYVAPEPYAAILAKHGLSEYGSFSLTCTRSGCVTMDVWGPNYFASFSRDGYLFSLHGNTRCMAELDHYPQIPDKVAYLAFCADSLQTLDPTSPGADLALALDPDILTTSFIKASPTWYQVVPYGDAKFLRLDYALSGYKPTY